MDFNVLFLTITISILIILMIMNMLFYMLLVLIRGINAGDIERNSGKIKSSQLNKLRWVEENKTSYENRALLAIYFITFISGAVIVPVSVNYYFQYFVPILQNWSLMQDVLPFFFYAFALLIYIVLFLVFIFVTMAFVILIPRRLSIMMNFKTIAGFISFLMFASAGLRPITYFTDLLAKGILSVLGIKKSSEENDVTEEEIISMVNEGHEQGVLEASEAEMIHNIFEYGDKEAQDIMTKRNNIIAIDANMPFQEAVDFMIHENNSRFPVFEENLDNIIGIINIKDAIRFKAVSKKAKGMVKSYPGIIRKAVFVPETKNIDDLFKEMQSKKLQMVIVSDEYGQTTGLVAMEDILEEIVGNILDEYDVEEEYIEERSDDTYEIEGLTPLEELENELNISFDSDHFDTLNGFMISRLEHIPAPDERFELDFKGYKFEILEVENRIIKTVLVTKHK